MKKSSRVVRERYAARVVGKGDWWLYRSGAIGIQCGARNTRHLGGKEEALELIEDAKNAPEARWSGLEKGDWFRLVRLVRKISPRKRADEPTKEGARAEEPPPCPVGYFPDRKPQKEAP